MQLSRDVYSAIADSLSNPVISLSPPLSASLSCCYGHSDPTNIMATPPSPSPTGCCHDNHRHRQLLTVLSQCVSTLCCTLTSEELAGWLCWEELVELMR